MPESKLYILLGKYLTEELAPEDKQELQRLLLLDEQRPELEQFIDGYIENLRDDQLLENPAMLVEMQEKLAAIINGGKSVQPVRHISTWRSGWLRYAAAVLMVFSIGAYWWIKHNDNNVSVTVNKNTQPQTDIGPGGDKAVLTLGDGTKIALENAVNGNLAQQGNAQVIKLSNGQISYKVQGQPGNELTWNTVNTPKGGQFRVVLPDGTKVWLNAASSITFPTEFTGSSRPVKITGEVYFEVFRNKQKRFIVDVDGTSTVEDLGTSFNINTYRDESSIRTTLIEGSLKITRRPASAQTGRLPSVILKPGQQASITIVANTDAKNGEGIAVESGVNLDRTLAWKNGLFNFNGADLQTVMRQLERWYDIKVEYKGATENIVFEGEMYRNANLNDVLEMLQKMGVKFSVEGKTLIVGE